MKKPESTKEQLITSAGELFAEHGFGGVSTRMIADRAGVKLSGIHYHFGSKEKLYIEACLTAHRRCQLTTFADILEENPTLASTPEGQAEIVRNAVFRCFHDHFYSKRPDWEINLLLREMISPTSAMTTLVDLIFRPEAESAALFYQRVKPTASYEEAAAWFDLMYGEIFFYTVARNTIQMVRGVDTLSTEFFQLAAAKLARAMILEAGLPLPADLVR